MACFCRCYLPIFRAAVGWPVVLVCNVSYSLIICQSLLFIYALFKIVSAACCKVAKNKILPLTYYYVLSLSLSLSLSLKEVLRIYNCYVHICVRLV